MKVYLDDVRTPLKSDEWEIVRNYDDFKKLIDEKFDEIEEISFDHDLATEHYHSFMNLEDPTYYNSLYHRFKVKTGLHCAQALINKSSGDSFPKINVHSMNPIGSRNIVEIITSHLISKGINPHEYVSNATIPFTTSEN